ncbi:MAG: SPOR domain-containing protein [Bacteroidota bacterium]
MRKIVLIFIACFLSISVFAQQRRIELAQTGLMSDGYGSNNAQVFINGNSKLINIIKYHKELNKEDIEIRGWRIRVYMGSGKNARTQANSVKLKIRNWYPDVEPHLVHHSPYFKILVGDFRTRIEAESFRKKLVREYPNCYVVESEILRDNL